MKKKSFNLHIMGYFIKLYIFRVFKQEVVLDIRYIVFHLTILQLNF